MDLKSDEDKLIPGLLEAAIMLEAELDSFDPKTERSARRAVRTMARLLRVRAVGIREDFYPYDRRARRASARATVYSNFHRYAKRKPWIMPKPRPRG